jgi:hypothetical protein
MIEKLRMRETGTSVIGFGDEKKEPTRQECSSS